MTALYIFLKCPVYEKIGVCDLIKKEHSSSPPFRKINKHILYENDTVSSADISKKMASHQFFPEKLAFTAQFFN